MGFEPKGEDSTGSTFLFDLRQRRAKLIGDNIDDVQESLKMEKFYQTFKNLEDLYSVANHAFEDRVKAEKDFQEHKKKIIELANNHRAEWEGKSTNAKLRADIEKSLRELFEFLLLQIEDAGLFGTKWEDDEGL